MATHADARRPEWLVPALLVVLSLVPAVAGTARLAELASGGEPTADNARFLAAPWPLLLHVLAVIPYSILGAFQFHGSARLHRDGWHRAAGRALVGLGLLAAFTGLWMTLTYPWPAGDGVALYVLRLIFGAAMAGSILAGMAAIRRRDFATHSHWMMRGYAIGLGAGTQVLTHLPWFLLVGKPDETPRAVMMGLGWIINLAVAEAIIRRSRRARSSAAGSHSFAPPGRSAA